MEAKKYTIAGKEFTMRFPSYSRCEKAREVMGDELANMANGSVKDFDKFLGGCKEVLDGDLSEFNSENLTLGRMEVLTGAIMDFFTLSRETV